MKHTLALTLVLVCLTALDCSKKESLNIPSTTSIASTTTPKASEGIFGTWSWYNSIGGITGKQVLTPSSVGYTVTIVFRSDSTFQYIRNGTLQATTRFSISRRRDAFTVDTMDVITYQDHRFVSQVIYALSADSLELRDECYDCMGSGYTRVQ